MRPAVRRSTTPAVASLSSGLLESEGGYYRESLLREVPIEREDPAQPAPAHRGKCGTVDQRQIASPRRQQTGHGLAMQSLVDPQNVDLGHNVRGQRVHRGYPKPPLEQCAQFDQHVAAGVEGGIRAEQLFPGLGGRGVPDVIPVKHREQPGSIEKDSIVVHLGGK